MIDCNLIVLENLAISEHWFSWTRSNNSDVTESYIRTKNTDCNNCKIDGDAKRQQGGGWYEAPSHSLHSLEHREYYAPLSDAQKNASLDKYHICKHCFDDATKSLASALVSIYSGNTGNATSHMSYNHKLLFDKEQQDAAKAKSAKTTKKS